jgi:hypothetical protein
MRGVSGNLGDLDTDGKQYYSQGNKMAKVWAGFRWWAPVTTTMKCAVVKTVENSLTVELLSASRELRSVV